MKHKPVSQQEIACHPNAVGVHWHGDYFSMLCPFHDDHSPSLMVYLNSFECRAASCGRRGKLSELRFQLDTSAPAADRMPQLTFAWDDLCEGEAMTPREDFIQQSHSAAQFPDVKEWYVRRGLSDDTIEFCLLGWWRGWFVTPTFDAAHKPIRLILRAGPSIERSVPSKYMVSPGAASLFVPDWGLLRTKPRYVVFPWGVYDALTTYQLRHPTLTGAGPCSQLPVELFDPYRRYIYVIPDGEPLGELALAKVLVKSLDWRGRLVVLDYPEGVKDPNGFLQTKRGAELERQLAAATL